MISHGTSRRNGGEPDLLKAMLAGAIAGAGATVVMTGFQNAVSRLGQTFASDEKQEEKDSAADEQHEASEPATAQAADAIVRRFIGRGLSKQRKAQAGQVVHYSFGTSMGIVYSVTAEFWHKATIGRGAGFGTALMIGADEIGVPLAGLSGPPTQTPLSTHLYGLASHLVYGLTCEAIRSRIRPMLDGRRSAGRPAAVTRADRRARQPI